MSEGELEAALDGGVAGPAGHPHHNVFGNIRMLVDHDPDKLFGLTDLPEPFGFEDIVRLVGEAAGVPIDEPRPRARRTSTPARCSTRARRWGSGSAAARRGERVLFATGHPGDLDPLYGSIADLVRAAA